jgi:hypothetical protein
LDNYESISYNKNFLTGEEAYEKKIKKNTGVKGKVTISLFDAKTGNKTQEAYSENLIPELFFRDAFITSFVGGIMGSGQSRYTNAYNWFNYLYLTDSDKPENASEQRVMGNVIGYAHRNNPYSGSDPLQGSINRSETKLEVTDSKIRLNFVFDFPTNACNGTIESVYFCEAPPDDKDYVYSAAQIYGRENADDNDYTIYNTTNPRRYYAAYIAFAYAKCVNFTSPTKGYMVLDATNTTITQSTYLQFPDSLKGHIVYIPFDVNINDILLWEQAVKLLNASGNPLVAVPADPVKKFDGLEFACPYTTDDTVIIGYVQYYNSPNYYMRIYKWSKVGVLLTQNDICFSTDYKDEYNTNINKVYVSGNSIYLDGTIDILGYYTRTDAVTNETIYTSKWLRLNSAGQLVSTLNIKPKLGNSTWFATKGMDSGNIERRARIYDFRRGKTKIYLYYTGVQGGSSFWQCISNDGNLVEPLRKNFGYKPGYGDYRTIHNILGTDRWVERYNYAYNNYVYFYINNLLTSRPIGTHTRLTQTVEKTEANTMKVQYMFEVDLLTFGEDYY